MRPDIEFHNGKDNAKVKIVPGYGAKGSSAIASGSNCFYLFLPPESSVSFSFAFSAIPHSEDNLNAFKFLNDMQFSAVTLDVTGDVKDDGDVLVPPELNVYAIEPIQDSFKKTFASASDESAINTAFNLGWTVSPTP
jgi:hypothetical protein